MENLTKEEIELLQAALAFYEQEGLTQVIVNTTLAKGYAFIVGKLTEDEAQRQAIIEAEQLEERVVLLRAKLIKLKDKAMVEEL